MMVSGMPLRIGKGRLPKNRPLLDSFVRNSRVYSGLMRAATSQIFRITGDCHVSEIALMALDLLAGVVVFQVQNIHDYSTADYCPFKVPEYKFSNIQRLNIQDP